MGFTCGKQKTHWKKNALTGLKFVFQLLCWETYILCFPVIRHHGSVSSEGEAINRRVGCDVIEACSGWRNSTKPNLRTYGKQVARNGSSGKCSGWKKQKELNTRAYMMGELQKKLLISQRDAETKTKLANEKTWPWRTWNSNRNLWSTSWQNRVPVRKKILSKSWVTGTV